MGIKYYLNCLLNTLMIIRNLVFISTIIIITIIINIININIINITTTISIIILTSQVEEEPLRGQEGQLVMGVQQRFSLRPSYITSSPALHSGDDDGGDDDDNLHSYMMMMMMMMMMMTVQGRMGYMRLLP